MLTVHLEKLRFHSFQGVYGGEHKTGNLIEADVHVRYEEPSTGLDRIDQLISYEDLFNLVEARMRVPGLVLEKAAADIIDRIVETFPFVKEITVAIYKLNPPIIHFEGRVGITLTRTF
jgi:7,8-dihydroneopterin aldolase/epimerase/oxygenase